jgi:hypothetical protein
MSGKFEPKTPVNLAPPKDDPISIEFLSKCNGKLFPGSHLFCFSTNVLPILPRAFADSYLQELTRAYVMLQSRYLGFGFRMLCSKTDYLLGKDFRCDGQ